jgi:large repetitive protein
VLEDASAQSVGGWATAVSPGPASESSQNVTFSASADNTGLFAVQPAVAPNGTLTYTPAANANGVATVTVTAHDDGGMANGGTDTSAPRVFTITVGAVDDAPSFAAGPGQSILEDAGAKSVSGWATAVSPGPANESSQTVTFIVSADNTALFSVQPAVGSDGKLTYAPAANANGSATVTVKAKDDGGTANGGIDTSPPQTFSVTVAAVNDAPTFTAGADQTVISLAGAQSVAAWATSIQAGPADESSQSVTFSVTNDNPGLFAAQPAVAPNGTLTYTPTLLAIGSATVTVRAVDDGGTANGGSDTSPPQTFTITII